MGIRIHKAMGWGLVDVKTTNGRITDDRFNIVSDEDSGWYETCENSLEKFISWVRRERKREAIKLAAAANNTTPGNKSGQQWGIDMFEIHGNKINRKEVLKKYQETHFFTHDSEGGNPEVVVFCPLGQKSFYRSDDTIDYYETSNMEPTVKLLNRCGIYPWVGLYKIPGAPTPPSHPFDKETIDKITMDPAHYQMLVGRWDEDQPAIATGEIKEYLLKYYRPKIPDSILLYTHFVGIFKDWIKTVQELRPMIYTFWS